MIQIFHNDFLLSYYLLETVCDLSTYLTHFMIQLFPNVSLWPKYFQRLIVIQILIQKYFLTQMFYQDQFIIQIFADTLNDANTSLRQVMNQMFP